LVRKRRFVAQLFLGALEVFLLGPESINCYTLKAENAGKMPKRCLKGNAAANLKRFSVLFLGTKPQIYCGG